MSLTKKYIEKKYNCILNKDSGFDGGGNFWTCLKNYEDDEEYLCDGWTLLEIETKLKERIK